jgi:hypothetical protein
MMRRHLILPAAMLDSTRAPETNENRMSKYQRELID